MPEYLAPGVYIDEVSFRAKTIEGVSTSTAGFVGPTRYGPTSGPPELLTSLADFERIYGGLDQLSFDDGNGPSHNYLAHGVRAFFEEGGKRLYVSRIYNGLEGFAWADSAGADSLSSTSISLRARFPGVAGNMRITFIPRLSENLLVNDPLNPGENQVRRIQANDTVVHSNPTDGTFDIYEVVRVDDDLELDGSGGATIASLVPTTDSLFILTVDVLIERPISRPKRPRERFTLAEVLEGFSFNAANGRSLRSYFAENPLSRRLQLTVPFWIDAPVTVDTSEELAMSLLGGGVVASLELMKSDNEVSQTEMQQVYRLTNGSDGEIPTAAEYRNGGVTGDVLNKAGFAALEDLEDISIVAAPGYTQNYGTNAGDTETIQAHLINHAHLMRYRIAVLDTPVDQVLSEVRAYRGKIDSDHAALYYPWVRIQDPITEEEISLPPSGFVTGIYARNDVENGVHKAPANEVVRLAIGFESMLNKGQQDVLNPEGINCFRFFEGRGYRLWGARTISSDPEWKYVNVRRYFAYLERSIDKGSQWAVFENNDETLWANVRRTMEDFLFNEWKSDRLMGEKPAEAFFVRCDRSTMTQNDLDNGRLICLIGVAPVRPAEFVIFRMGQWTADAKR
jgi:uncharacterized protein